MPDEIAIIINEHQPYSAFSSASLLELLILIMSHGTGGWAMPDGFISRYLVNRI